MIYIPSTSTLPLPDRPPYSHSRSTGDHCLSLPFGSSGYRLPRQSRHPADFASGACPATRTTRPASLILGLVGSAPSTTLASPEPGHLVSVRSAASLISDPARSNPRGGHGSRRILRSLTIICTLKPVQINPRQNDLANMDPVEPRSDELKELVLDLSSLLEIWGTASNEQSRQTVKACRAPACPGCGTPFLSGPRSLCLLQCCPVVMFQLGDGES
ncbi:uncharacterized protein LOC122864767 [Siniperca chuatsi]|uniref:uncharacterized protein LOC122864767 n=1 Tax=Siniperca chuatsi TaxID=119488 RepID=UPI001CE0F0F3|nr:uncharacterized protein LOC122864767 [Siniperca chuatsi]